METDVLETRKTILEFVVDARLEIERKKKKLSVNDEVLVQKVIDRVAADSMVFASVKDQRRRLDVLAHEVAWLEANMEESEEIIRRLKSGDESFAMQFFYGTNPDECNVSRIRNKILSRIRQSCDVEVSVEEFGNLLYALLWNEGRWDILDKYSCKGDFFCWLAELSQHELVKYLKDVKMVRINRERTAGNTRLLGRSVEPEKWERVLTELMPDGQYKDVLFSALVKRETDEMMMKSLDLDKNSLRKLRKMAENDLKNRLIRSDGGYEDLVLRDKSPRIIEVSDELSLDLGAWQDAKGDTNPLADVLGVDLSKEELQEKVMEFLYTIPDKLKWTEEERVVWTLRFIEDVPPLEVAERVGRKRSWVDNKYSRLNARFNKAVKAWWSWNAK